MSSAERRAGQPSGRQPAAPDGDGGAEPAVLVGVALAGRDVSLAEASLDELERLADTAGAEAVATLLQRRDRPHPATHLRRGQAHEGQRAPGATPTPRLEGALAHLDRTRATKRKARRQAGLVRLALVGYTNAGKSTLLNALTQAGVTTEDRLFSTLDPTTRRLELASGQTVLVSDTVGFVRKLPHHLVEAFKSTLEEVTEADLLVHVVDATASDPVVAMAAVREVLGEIGARSVPELIVLNKS